jgi:hypothetical protein
MINVHQACTRAARADYCGDGVSHTNPDTPIIIWDQLIAPQIRGLPATLNLPTCAPYLPDPFEDAWSTRGAICTTHWRWTNLVGNDGGLLSALCPNANPNNPPPLSDGKLGFNICESQQDALNLVSYAFSLSPPAPAARQIPVFIGSDSYLPLGTPTCQ